MLYAIDSLSRVGEVPLLEACRGDQKTRPGESYAILRIVLQAGGELDHVEATPQLFLECADGPAGGFLGLSVLGHENNKSSPLGNQILANGIAIVASVRNPHLGPWHRFRHQGLISLINLFSHFLGFAWCC